MNHIYKGVYVGGLESLRQMESVRKQGIRGVVRLDFAAQLSAQWSKDFDLLYVPFSDGQFIPNETFPQITSFIHKHVQQNESVLVHCQMGISRSSTMVLAYLIEYEGMSLAQAYVQLIKNRPIAYPHPALLKSLVTYYSLPYDPNQIGSMYFRDNLIAEARAGY